MRENRLKRVGELIREEIAAMLTKGLKDPRLGFVSVLAVRVSSDLRYANVYVSVYGKENERKSSLVALRNSSGWMRRELGKRIRLRFTPELRFFEDDTLDKVFHMEEVFREIHAESEKDGDAGE